MVLICIHTIVSKEHNITKLKDLHMSYSIEKSCLLKGIASNCLIFVIPMIIPIITYFVLLFSL